MQLQSGVTREIYKLMYPKKYESAVVSSLVGLSCAGKNDLALIVFGIAQLFVSLRKRNRYMNATVRVQFSAVPDRNPFHRFYRGAFELRDCRIKTAIRQGALIESGASREIII